MTAERLDSRAWLIWGAAAAVPLLVARNPVVVMVVLISVVTVRTVWSSQARQGWQWIVRIAVLFMIVGVIFNALTVHSGDQVLLTVPDDVPLIGGAITLNAIAYGIVSGVAIVTLVLTGTTVAAGLIWADLMRSMPPRIAPIAVAGSVAWSFLPSASQAFQQIRESQAARGHRIRGLRDVPALVVPLLGGGLERAITMSEALESRGFGQSGTTEASSPVSRWLLVGAIGSGVLTAYAFAVSQVATAIVGFALATAFALMAMRVGAPGERVTTRYRASSWTQADLIVVGASCAVLIVFFWRNAAVPGAAVFNPYPRLEWPMTDLWMLLGLALLMVPALIVPNAREIS